MLNNGGHLNFGNAFQFGNYGNQINWNNHQNNNVNPPRAIRKPAINKKQQPQPPKQATDKNEVKKTTTDKKIEQKKLVLEQKGEQKKQVIEQKGEQQKQVIEQKGEQQKQVIEQKGEQKKEIEQKKQVIEQKGEQKNKIEQKKQVIEQKGEQKKQVIEQKGEQKKTIEQKKQVIEQKGEQKKQVIEEKGEQKKTIEQKKQVIEQKGEQKKQVIEEKGEQKKPASAASSINNNKTEKKQSDVLPKTTTTAAKKNVEKRTATEPLQSGKAKKQKYDGKKRGFIVAGVKLPYVKPNTKMEEEEKSYAVTFFEHKPIYNTSIYAVDNDGDMDKYEDDGNDTDNEFEIGRPTIRKRINNKWSRIYEERNYKCWLTWWKAFKWCELQINKKLESFGSLNIKHKFLPYYKKQMSTQDVIINLMKRARFSLETKSNNFRDFKVIYELMNETFLENLLPATAEKLQHMIRKIPNHLWLYKMRRMVYIWAEYYKLSDNLTNNFSGLQKRWKSPAFHWLCKQAFDELKTLSTIEWPKHKEMYNKLKSVKS
ncbi:formin-E-like [Drosophila sulfurigaster albostrigata]|uniref:formin-E-like n=1 Tax=Drosophila sulfurigaster albostrigata TaxID=89887 RepID=UPI002D21CDB2|nr:formin-E-like [Drosophila sulfurigaster albostrigata]